MTYQRHLDIHRNCICNDYKPDFITGDLRLTGENFYCAKCDHYVSSKKWKGGIVLFGIRSRFVKFYFCPCCGIRMRYKIRAKARTRASIKDQEEHPEKYSRYIISKLKEKQKLLKNNFLNSTVT